MTVAGSPLDQIAAALEPHGLVLRGGFIFDATCQAPERADGSRPQSVVLIGHFGSSIWPHFAAWHRVHREASDPLDSWSKHVINSVAAGLGASAVFPSDRPYLPFQQWAMRAEGLQPSPLGMLIHPQYGLWQAFRGALLFDERLVFPPLGGLGGHPCDTCRDKPCLHTCPVEAFDGRGYALGRCRDHLASPAGQPCMDGGCLARLACPVGRDYGYVSEQQRFHMAAFKTG